MRARVFSALLTLSLAQSGWASYISEALEVPVRSGDSLEYRILRFLPAGADITVLEALPSGYSRIRDSQDREGFVLTRQVMDQPPASSRLAAQQAALKAAEEKLAQAEAELISARETISTQRAELNVQLDRAEASEQALAQLAGADALSIRDRLVRLETERQMLLSENERLKAERLAASDDSAKAWFGIGALTLGVGVLFGFLMPRIRRNRVHHGL